MIKHYVKIQRPNQKIGSLQLKKKEKEKKEPNHFNFLSKCFLSSHYLVLLPILKILELKGSFLILRFYLTKFFTKFPGFQDFSNKGKITCFLERYEKGLYLEFFLMEKLLGHEERENRRQGGRQKYEETTLRVPCRRPRGFSIFAESPLGRACHP